MADSPKSQLLIWALAAIVVVVAGARLLDSGSGAAAGPPPPVSVEGPREPRGDSGLYVHVAGEVRRPGLYRVPAGSRVAAALARAGGPSRRAALTTVNLAAKVEDGQQVVVPGRGAAAAPAASSATAGDATAGGAAAPAAGPVSLSSATVEQLDALDGIGPTLAQRILAYRQAHGGFRSVDELRQVEGIGDKRFESLRQAVSP
jgi:competence protein ComEA